MSQTAVDLKDRKVAAAIQLVFVAVAVVMVGGALLLDFPMSSGGDAWVTISVAVVSCVVYMAVHELTHAVLLWAFSRVRPTVALRIPYLAVGGRGYLNRRSFIIVALAPVVLWGIVLVMLLFTLSSQFFLPVYVVTVLNFAGSSGDYFQAYAVARLPGDASDSRRRQDDEGVLARGRLITASASLTKRSVATRTALSTSHSAPTTTFLPPWQTHGFLGYCGGVSTCEPR